MLNWLRQKYAARAARRAQLRETQKAADAALKADPLLYKRAVRRSDRALLRRWGLRAAFAVAVTGVTTVEPDLVSTPLDTHAAAHGVKDGLQQHFATQGIRVYHRRNPLMPFHLAGQNVRVGWQSSESGIVSRSIGVPFNYVGGLFNGFSGVLFPSALDAYSLSDSRDHAQRQCFIRPPGDVDSVTLLRGFTGIGGNITSDDQNDASVKRYYYTLIMTHEARHCDQDKNMKSALNEIDADVTADVLTRGMLSEERTLALRDYWGALRLTGAVVGNDVGHYSTVALIRGGVTPMQAIDDSAVVRRLVQVLQDAEAVNALVLPKEMSRIERRYHLSASLLAKQNAGDAQLRAKAAMFVHAVETLNARMQGYVIKTPHAQMAQRIDMSWLMRNYNPVQGENLPQPASSPRRSATPRAGS